MPDVFVAGKKAMPAGRQEKGKERTKRFSLTNDQPDKPTQPTPAEEPEENVVAQPTEEINPQSEVITQQSTTTTKKLGHMSIFSAFCENPEKVTFQTQEDGEEILLFLRKSFITNIPWILASAVLSVVPLFVFPIMRIFNATPAFIPSRYIFIFSLFYYLVVATFAFVRFITWYFNIGLITDRRIVDIDFADLVYKNISETKMTLVQDVSYTQAGVIRTIVDYGDVLVQTAGAVDKFNLTAVPRPEKVVQIIEKHIGKGRSNYAV